MILRNKIARFLLIYPPHASSSILVPQFKPPCSDLTRMCLGTRQPDAGVKNAGYPLSFLHTCHRQAAPLFFPILGTSFSPHRATNKPRLSMDVIYIFVIYWQTFKFCTLGKQCLNDAWLKIYWGTES